MTAAIVSTSKSVMDGHQTIAFESAKITLTSELRGLLVARVGNQKAMKQIATALVLGEGKEEEEKGEGRVG